MKVTKVAESEDLSNPQEVHWDDYTNEATGAKHRRAVLAVYVTIGNFNPQELKLLEGQTLETLRARADLHDTSGQYDGFDIISFDPAAGALVVRVSPDRRVLMEGPLVGVHGAIHIRVVDGLLGINILRSLRNEKDGKTRSSRTA